MCPVLYGVSGILPFGGSAAALTSCGAATRPAPARPVPPTVTPSAPRNFRRSTVLGLSMDSLSLRGPFAGFIGIRTSLRCAVDAMLSCICLVRDLSESRPKRLGPRPIGPPLRGFGWEFGGWRQDRLVPAALQSVYAYDLSRRPFSQQTADFRLHDGVPARRIA